MHIIPAILPKTKLDMELDFAKVELLETGHNLIHIDVADGIFVGSTTYPLHHGDRASELFLLPHGTGSVVKHFSVHCMVAHPEQVVPMYIRAGAAEIIVHVESFRTLDLLEAHAATWNVHNVRVVLAALLHTPIEKLVEAMTRTRIDRALLMSITSPGIQGAPFDRHVLHHIRELKRLYPSAHVAVDGGIHIDTIGDVAAEGVETAVVGSHLLHAKNIHEVYTNLEKKVQVLRS